ncbi:hypothetical protein A2U01_0057281, partial [Trifolium medium]|nr:hypothetical protein [Trifolium medium]
KCVELSPSVINKFLGRSEDPQADLEVTDNVDKSCELGTNYSHCRCGYRFG